MLDNETEILPGVFFTPKEELGLPKEQLDAFKELPTGNLQFELANLKNSLAHLHSSNDEMEKFVKDDKDLAKYIVENIQFMAQIRIKINKIEEILLERGDSEI